MKGESTVYTIGTALNRAHDTGTPVEVLVEGMWISGRVLAVDGFGVVLHGERDQHSVIRIESISAVTVHGRMPEDAEAASSTPKLVPGPRTASS